MAIVMDRIAGVLDIVTGAYVRVTKCSVDYMRGMIELQISTYVSKKAREIEIVQEHLRKRRDAVKTEKPVTQEQLDELGWDKSTWDAYTMNGPWSFEERRWLEDHIFHLYGKPIQGSDMGFPLPKDFPEIVNKDTILQWAYGQMKEGGTLVPAVASPGDHREVSLNSIEDDYETSEQVLARYIEDFSILGL